MNGVRLKKNTNPVKNFVKSKSEKKARILRSKIV